MSSTEKVLRAKLQLVDNYTAPMRKAIFQTKTFQTVAKSVKPLILKAKDMASKVISKVNSTLKSFVSKVWSATVSVKDKASSLLSGIQGKLSALALGTTITELTGFKGDLIEEVKN